MLLPWSCQVPGRSTAPRKYWSVNGPKAFEDAFLLNTRTGTKNVKKPLNFKRASNTSSSAESWQLYQCMSRRSQSRKPTKTHKHQKIPVHREQQLNDLLLCDAKWHLGGLTRTYCSDGNLFTLEISIVFRLFASKERPKWKWPLLIYEEKQHQSCNEMQSWIGAHKTSNSKENAWSKGNIERSDSKESIAGQKFIESLPIWVLALVSFLSVSLTCHPPETNCTAPQTTQNVQSMFSSPSCTRLRANRIWSALSFAKAFCSASSHWKVSLNHHFCHLQRRLPSLLPLQRLPTRLGSCVVRHIAALAESLLLTRWQPRSILCIEKPAMWKPAYGHGINGTKRRQATHMKKTCLPCPWPWASGCPTCVGHPLAFGSHSYHLRVHGACLHSSLALLVAHQRPRELVDQLSGMMMGHKHLDEGNPIKHKH